MVIVAAGVLWTGYLVMFWGRALMSHGQMGSASDVGIADLAIPGHYAKRAAATQATSRRDAFGNPT